MTFASMTSVDDDVEEAVLNKTIFDTSKIIIER